MNKRIFVVLNELDNVGTLIDNKKNLTFIRDDLILEKGIPFGHKFALNYIPIGGPIIKYGVTIGHATHSINSGEHVHIHNCI